ncbi:peroxisomal succinyl-coenzyme A thioesterase-like isoform X2 [Sphaeramia orbicularis]|uniref:peroxisomal succinyl-coenzyme A thioesterase-like isoform X2 n=1 Tax=Sphaeramia orbicularis TaxID=375764 RepID=UPI00117E6A57|nr:peroxisomal succinyl-coenzyme A thioesterase-like isoform X2 [Sphaeramia orbicularis]
MSRNTLRPLTVKMITSLLRVHRKLSSLNPAVGAVCGVRWSSGLNRPPLLSAAPARALMDEQIIIKGRFLPPHCPVTVCAQLHSDDGDLWQSFAHYNTNADGTVNLASDHSVGGSYLGCEPMGLFWGLEPAPGSREGLRLRKKNVETPYVVHMSLLEGHVSQREEQSVELAVATTERWYMAPGVKRKDIRQNGVVGTLFLPPGPGPFPAMLDMWGMGGGLMEYRSALLASRGYAAFSLAYFGHKDLPGPQTTINVGDAYFKSAFQFLQDHHQICANRVGIIGLSFGVYLTLRMAAHIGVKASCLICINGPVGSVLDLVDADGRCTAFEESSQKHWSFDERGYVSFRDISSPGNFNPENKLKLENISCPLMWVVGEDDMSASSIENADVMEETLKASGKAHLFTRLSYPGAGHLIEPPYSPNARLSLWSIKPVKFTIWGGYPAPHAAAQEDAWRKILDFLDTNLRGFGQS